MSVPTDPTTVNESRLTTAHRQTLQQARTRALEAYAVASATAERISLLSSVEEPLVPAKVSRPRASKVGKPWTPAEEQALIASFDAGTPIDVLADTHERTRGGIRARLVRLEKISDDDFPNQVEKVAR